MCRLACIVATTTVLVACSGGGGGSTSPPPGPPPPSALSYSSPETAVVGQALSVSPSVSGSVSNYTVSPALPPGLSINVTTGTISGTPSSTSAQTTYTVTASNNSGSTTFAWVLTVNPAAPTALTYSTPPALLVGQAISPLTPTVTGTVTTYTVSPALPTGLTINSSTGVIAGTPSGIAAAATYTVTASNVTGQTSFALALTVDPGPTVQLTVTAADPNGYALAYQWKTTDGALLSVNGPQASWMLPSGPGFHFAYVLVSNGRGGYTQGRVRVNTDTIGNKAVIPPPTNLNAPKTASLQGDFYRSFVDVGDYFPTPDILVYLQDNSSVKRYPASAMVTTSLRGEFVIPGVPPLINYTAWCSVDGGTTYNTCTDGNVYNGFPPPPLSSVAVTDYGVSGGTSYPSIVGSFALQDGNRCGTVNEFFGVTATATATLLDSSGNKLVGPARVDEFGYYALPSIWPNAFEGKAATVSLQCENAAPVTVAIGSLNATGETWLGSATLMGSSAPTVSAISATYDGSPIGTFLPPTSGLVSDSYPRADQFLRVKGLDTRVGACLYYQAIGAVASCDAAGNPSGAISFEDWKRAVKIGTYASGASEYTATYINKVDVNLTRNHHSITYGPSQTAAYKCNHLGPPTLNSIQSDIDMAIDNAVNGKNLEACGAIDVTPGANGQESVTRFLIFGPSGELLLSVNLDGRQEKFVPGTCVACHGGDHYAGKFPEDGTGLADVGGHFLPYDVGNFEFHSSSSGTLTKCAQEEAIYRLNQIVLSANPTNAETELIAGWYSTTNGSQCPGVVHALDESYVPTSWQGQSAVAVSFYQNVQARSCRYCHVALVEGYNYDHYQNITPGGPAYRSGSPDAAVGITTCDLGGVYQIVRSHSMPNSLVTFNRFWGSAGTSVDQPAILTQFFSSNGIIVSCTPGQTP